jgi:hypothetical protein
MSIVVDGNDTFTLEFDLPLLLRGPLLACLTIVLAASLRFVVTDSFSSGLAIRAKLINKYVCKTQKNISLKK